MANDPAALVHERRVAVHDSGFRMVCQRSDDTLDRVDGEQTVVAVHPADDLPAARLERLVDGVGLSSVGLALPADSVAGVRQDLTRPVGRASVHHHVLDPRVGLPRDGVETIAQETPLVERRRQDRDERQVVRHGEGRSCLVSTIIG